MNAFTQQRLFAMPADERTLGDVDRTILEAIDKLGPITARAAGRIAYRLRGFTLTLAIPGPWLTDAGARALVRLERHGLVRQTRGRWARLGGAAR